MIRTPEVLEIMGQASRDGVTNETIPSYLNMAGRAERLGDAEFEAQLLRKALDVHDTWGAKLPESYGMSPQVHAVVTARLAAISV